MPVQLNTFLWPDHGIEPLNNEDAIYTAGENPIAGYDNYVMRQVTEDLHGIRDWANDHVSEHESGGSQQINLDALAIGSQGSLETTTSSVYLAGEADATVVEYDNDTGAITTLAEVRGNLDVYNALSIRTDIEDYDGNTLYDATADRFHHAAEADAADHADQADNATLFANTDISEFLFGDDAETITGAWEFTQPIDTDIHGHASTASQAAVAAQADDSDLLEGQNRQSILDDAWAAVEDEFVDVQNDGAGVLANARTLDFDTSIDVSVDGDAATMEVTSVPHAVQADDAADSALLEGQDRQSILDDAWDNVDGMFADIANNGASVLTDASVLNFEEAIEVDIDGGTATMDVQSVPHAVQADDADDATLHDGWTVQEIIDASWDDVKDEFLDVRDDNVLRLENARSLDFADSIDVTVDGDRAVMGVTSVPHAVQADDADHADAADLADDANLHEGYTVNEILDEAYTDFEDDLVDIRDDGNVVQQDVRTVDLRDSIDVSTVGSDRVNLSVTKVPEASHADDANDTVLHEGNTVQDIVNMATASGGEWTHLDTLASPDLGTGGMQWSVPDGYDMLRLLVVNEPHTDYQWNDIYLRVNNETRNRYRVLRRQYWNDDSYYSHQHEGKDFYEGEQDYFTLCKTNDDITAMAEYTLALPPEITGDGQQYISNTLSNEWITPTVGQNEIRGMIEVPYSSIDELDFFVGGGGSRGASSFYCVIHGKSIL